MSSLLITGVRVATPGEVHSPGWLATDGATIAAVGAGDPPAEVADARDTVDGAGGLLLPGFIDVHVHGAGGHETMDANPAGLEAMAAFAARHGVTALLPTTWTAGTADTLAALKAVASLLPERLEGARIVGAHMEGPYLSAHHCGAQDREHIRHADRDEANRFLDTGVVRLMTIAPEVGDNLWLVAECARRGVTPSIGHTGATYDQVLQAVEAGARHATHTYNAMRPLHHREPGTVGAVLSCPEIAAELIADGIHVHPAAMRVLHAAKGAHGMLLVTDATRATGLDEGPYDIGDRTVHVSAGAVRLEDGALAGSVLTMDRAFRNLVAATGIPPERLWPVASHTAARSVGLGDRKGALTAGLDADLVLLDRNLEVVMTVVEGRIVHRRLASAVTESKETS